MDIEKKTLIYIFIGLLYLSTTVGLQVNPDINKILFGKYDEDSHPDLVVENESYGGGFGDLNNFVYSGHYISETSGLGSKAEVHEGLFLFRLGDNNYLEKKYNRIPPNSSIRITAFNDIIFNSDVSYSYHCETLNMTVKQNGAILETLEVNDTRKPEKFKVKTQPSNSESNIRLSINQNKKCSNIPQILGIDKFYLEEPSNAKPAGLFYQTLHIIPLL